MDACMFKKNFCIMCIHHIHPLKYTLYDITNVQAIAELFYGVNQIHESFWYDSCEYYKCP